MARAVGREHLFENVDLLASLGLIWIVRLAWEAVVAKGRYRLRVQGVQAKQLAILKVGQVVVTDHADNPAKSDLKKVFSNARVEFAIHPTNVISRYQALNLVSRP